MKTTIATVVTAILISSFSVPGFSYGEEKESSQASCAKTKAEYRSAQQKWSGLNAEASVKRSELERLRNLRWDMKVALNVLADAQDLVSKDGTLTHAQTLTLNSRLQNNIGELNPDGTFTMFVIKSAPMKLKDAATRIKRLLKGVEEDIASTDTLLRARENQSNTLSSDLTSLESIVEAQCRAAGEPTVWEEGAPRTSGSNIAQRYIEREQQRQAEVDEYYYRDQELLYYAPSYRRKFQFRALLIRLDGFNGKSSSLNCFPFNSQLDKRFILDELGRASSHHDTFPRIGKLGEFHVLDSFDDVSHCRKKLIK